LNRNIFTFVKTLVIFSKKLFASGKTLVFGGRHLETSYTHQASEKEPKWGVDVIFLKANYSLKPIHQWYRGDNS
jgi:hypothetical protein